MDIIVVSRRNGGTKAPEGYSVVYVGRPTALGNPFHVGAKFSQEAAAEEFRYMLREELDDRESKYHRAIKRIWERAKSGEKIALECWCAPLPCHADSIKEEILNFEDWL